MRTQQRLVARYIKNVKPGTVTWIGVRPMRREPMMAAIGLGLGVVFLNYPVVHQIIKIVGIVYLLFLAWKIANSSNPNASERLGEPLTFFQAVVFQWVNPKAWIIAVGAIATYTTVGNVTEQVLIIILGYATVGSICMALWLLMGAF